MSDEPTQRLTQLFTAHAPRVVAFLLHRGAGPAAEDLLSEVFTVAWRRLDDVPESALPWLLVVARNTLAHHWRATARRTELHEELRRTSGDPVSGVPGAAAGSPDVAEAVVERDDVLRALAALSDEDREVLLLVGWDGLSGAEAAAVLEVSTGAFAVRLHRARRRLVRLLDADPAGAPPPRTAAGASRLTVVPASGAAPPGRRAAQPTTDPTSRPAARAATLQET